MEDSEISSVYKKYNIPQTVYVGYSNKNTDTHKTIEIDDDSFDSLLCKYNCDRSKRAHQSNSITKASQDNQKEDKYAVSKIEEYSDELKTVPSFTDSIKKDASINTDIESVQFNKNGINMQNNEDTKKEISNLKKENIHLKKEIEELYNLYNVNISQRADSIDGLTKKVSNIILDLTSLKKKVNKLKDDKKKQLVHI